MTHRQIDKKKIFFYVLSFLILSTLNNIYINNSQISKISKIEVRGLNEKNNLDILKKLEFLNLKSILFLKKKDITDIIQKNNLVESFYVKKKYPSSLDIKLIKTRFLANIKVDKKFFLVGSNSKLIKSKSVNNDLPYLSENSPVDEFVYFSNIIEKSIFDYNQISSIYFFPSKRWDIKTKKEVLIKLPMNNIDQALKNAHKIINNKKFLDIKLIDLRIKNQVILDD